MSDHASPVKARRRADVRYAVLAMLGVAAFAWIVISFQGLSRDLRTANEARDALARQVQQLGGTPVAGSPGSRGDVGPSGPQGERGPSGPPGPAGSSGSPGATGRTGASGASGTPGSVGASGSPGVSGNDGVAGSPGPAGAQGEPGPAGADGKDGTDGKNGSPPAGWSYTDAAGAEYDCEPVTDFNASSPRYTCTPAPTPTPSDSSTPQGLLGVAMVAATGSYRRIATNGGPRA